MSWEPTRNLSVNVQAAKGFRLGGINDPLNLPLCTPADLRHLRPFASDLQGRTLWNYEAGVKYSKRGITFNAAAFHNEIRDLQVTVDCRQLLVAHRVQRSEGAHDRHRGRVRGPPGAGPRLVARRQHPERGVRFDGLPAAGRVIGGIRKGNRLPTVPKFQIAAIATYGRAFNDNADWYVNGSVQHIGNRFTQPGDQEPGAGIVAVLCLRSGRRARSAAAPTTSVR